MLCRETRTKFSAPVPHKQCRIALCVSGCIPQNIYGILIVGKKIKKIGLHAALKDVNCNFPHILTDDILSQ